MQALLLLQQLSSGILPLGISPSDPPAARSGHLPPQREAGRACDALQLNSLRIIHRGRPRAAPAMELVSRSGRGGRSSLARNRVGILLNRICVAAASTPPPSGAGPEQMAPWTAPLRISGKSCFASQTNLSSMLTCKLPFIRNRAFSSPPFPLPTQMYSF